MDGSVRWLEYVDKGCLLDVGCGNGWFLDRMRQLGWEVMGVQHDGDAVSVAKERFGLEVFQGSLEEARFPDGCFDTVTMNHVIEHVIDPVRLLKECRRVMKTGGKLVVATPNIKSLGCRVFDEHWRGLEVPRHLHLFSPQSLRACAEHASLEIRVMRTSARSASWMFAASSSIRRYGLLRGGPPGDCCRGCRGWPSWLRSTGLRGPGEA